MVPLEKWKKANVAWGQKVREWEAILKVYPIAWKPLKGLSKKVVAFTSLKHHSGCCEGKSLEVVSLVRKPLLEPVTVMVTCPEMEGVAVRGGSRRELSWRGDLRMDRRYGEPFSLTPRCRFGVGTALV